MTRKKASTSKISTGMTNASKAAAVAGKDAPETKAAQPVAKVVSIAPVAPTDVSADAPPAQVMVKKKELIERVVLRSGLKPREIKPALDALLAELGDALMAGESLNLPPLGKITVNRTKETENGNIAVLKLKQNKPSAKSQDDMSKDDAAMDDSDD